MLPAVLVESEVDRHTSSLHHLTSSVCMYGPETEYGVLRIYLAGLPQASTSRSCADLIP